MIALVAPLLVAACGTDGGAEDRVAADLAERGARGETAPPVEDLEGALRREGEDAAWPHALIARIPDGSDPLKLVSLLRTTLARVSTGPFRCGAHESVGPGGVHVVAVVFVEALAEFDPPLPREAHAGGWVSVGVRVGPSITQPSIVVLGPYGAPRDLLSTFDPRSRLLRASFAPDAPGRFAVQIMGEAAEGPRPLLTATVDVDRGTAAYVRGARGDEAPGEGLRSGSSADSLAAMVGAARRSGGARPLVRDGALDGVAHAHAERIAARGLPVHDAGDGDPAARIQSAVGCTYVAENVAHAPSLDAAHRALWTSPSHRKNLLSARATRIGLGVKIAADGSVYVVEEFADDPS